MPYFSSNSTNLTGRQQYQAPSTGRVQGVQGAREGFCGGGHGTYTASPSNCAAPCPPQACTLTAVAPPAACCHPAPLHCSNCGCGYFLASEAYGS